MTLTESAYWTKRLGVLAAGAGGLLMLLLVVVLVWPKEDPLPTYMTPNYKCTTTASEFSTHKLSIPSLQVGAGSEGVYTINTQTGKLDETPLIANVYNYAVPGPSLTAQQDAKDMAKSLGFDPEEIQRTASDYVWAEDEFGRTLQIDINTLNFRMKTDFTNSTALPDDDNKLPSAQEAARMASSFLSSKGWMLEDYEKEAPITIDINIEPDGSFSEAKSRSEAELIRVDFYRDKPFLSVRSDLDGAERIKYQLEQDFQQYDSEVGILNTTDGKVDVYEFNTVVAHVDANKSNITVYVGPKDERKENGMGDPNIYAIDYIAWPLEIEPCGTYPLISATELTTKIENGEGSLIYLNANGGDDVVPYQPARVQQFTINTVKVGYLDLEVEQTFLQPIYIVSGEATLGTGIKGTFHYYIPAIDYDNLQDPAYEAPVVDDGGDSGGVVNPFE